VSIASSEHFHRHSLNKKKDDDATNCEKVRWKMMNQSRTQPDIFAEFAQTLFTMHYSLFCSLTDLSLPMDRRSRRVRHVLVVHLERLVTTIFVEVGPYSLRLNALVIVLRHFNG
jgi:hypothetical protein